MAKEGVIVPLETKSVQKAFGQNLPQMRGKNTKAIFHGKTAMPPAARATGLAWCDVPMQNALRMIEEQSTKEIATKKASKAELDKAAKK